jgi:hypothetical protein
MTNTTTRFQIKQTRQIEAYDIIQVESESRSRTGNRFVDLMTLRDADDFRTALNMVANDAEHEYRIVSMNKRDVIVERVVEQKKVAKLTIAKVREIVKSYGLTMSAKRNDAGDFRINFPNGGEATAFYSADLDEIVGTAKAMGDELIVHKAQLANDAKPLAWNECVICRNIINKVTDHSPECLEISAAEYNVVANASEYEDVVGNASDVKLGLQRRNSWSEAVEIEAHAENDALRCRSCGELPLLDGHIEGCSQASKKENDEREYHAADDAEQRMQIARTKRSTTQTEVDTIDFDATVETFVCGCGHRVHVSREAIEMVRSDESQTDAHIAAGFDCCLYCATGSSVAARYELHAIDCAACQSGNHRDRSTRGVCHSCDISDVERVAMRVRKIADGEIVNVDICIHCAHKLATQKLVEFLRVGFVELIPLAALEPFRVDVAKAKAAGESFAVAQHREVLASAAAQGRPYSVERADERAAQQSVEQLERAAYGRAESYMRPMGATALDDARERGIADDVDELLGDDAHHGFGASQVLADEYEESNDETDEQKLVGSLVDLLYEHRDEIEHLPSPVRYVETFDQARAKGLLTDDAGIVLVLRDGVQIFLTLQVQ